MIGRETDSPGGCAKRCDPGLKHSLEEQRRILSSDEEVEETEGAQRVNQQPCDDGDHVKTKLLSSDRKVRQLHNLTGNQAHYTERRVPEQINNTGKLLALGPLQSTRWLSIMRGSLSLVQCRLSE